MTIAECENTKLLVLNVEMTSTNKNTSSPVKVEVKGKSSRDLLFYHEIPAWYQDNIYIHYGYRPVMESIRTCFESWTYISIATYSLAFLQSYARVYSSNTSRGLTHKRPPETKSCWRSTSVPRRFVSAFLLYIIPS